MSNTIRSIVGLCFVVALLAALPLVAQASDGAASGALRMRAEQLARDGRCEEAMPLLDRARAANPGDAQAAVVAGQCQIALKRYSDAVTSLEAAKAAPSSPPETDLYLGMARFHLGDLDGARRALADARTRTPDRPEVDFYEGLVLLSRAESREAAASLARARTAAPSQLDPVASYYEGLAWAGANERGKAREALERVIAQAPGTEWALAAERALKGEGVEGDPSEATRVFLEGQGADRAIRGLEGGEPERLWISLTGGIEYDTNVILRGNGVQLPAEISGQGDRRFAWSAEAGATLFSNRDWTLGLAGFYYGTAQEDLNRFNVHFPSLSTWLDRRLGAHDALRLQYDFGYAWIGFQPFLATQNIMPAYYHDWGIAGTTRLFGQATLNNFLFSNADVPSPTVTGGACPNPLGLCGPAGLDESSARNRDGYGFSLGIDHAVPLPIPYLPTWLRAGYRWHNYNARGTEYDYQAHEFRLGLRVQLPVEFVADAWASYTYQPFRHASTFPDPNRLFAGVPYQLSGTKRSDDVLQLEASLERAITSWLVGSVRYSYVQDHSNVKVFTYDRHILGAYLTVRFAK